MPCVCWASGAGSVVSDGPGVEFLGLVAEFIASRVQHALPSVTAGAEVGAACAVVEDRRGVTEKLRQESELRFRAMADSIPAADRRRDRPGPVSQQGVARVHRRKCRGGVAGLRMVPIHPIRTTCGTDGSEWTASCARMAAVSRHAAQGRGSGIACRKYRTSRRIPTAAQATTAKDGQEGIAAASQFRPDVAILDIGLPGISGYDVARHLRGQ